MVYFIICRLTCKPDDVANFAVFKNQSFATESRQQLNHFWCHFALLLTLKLEKISRYLVFLAFSYPGDFAPGDHRGAGQTVQPDFHLRFSLVASEIFRMGHAQRTKKYLPLNPHLKFKYFNFCEIFLRRNQSDFFREPRGHFRRIKNFSQNGRATALSDLREDRPILKTRITELQTIV